MQPADAEKMLAFADIIVKDTVEKFGPLNTHIVLTMALIKHLSAVRRCFNDMVIKGEDTESFVQSLLQPLIVMCKHSLHIDVQQIKLDEQLEKEFSMSLKIVEMVNEKFDKLMKDLEKDIEQVRNGTSPSFPKEKVKEMKETFVADWDFKYPVTGLYKGKKLTLTTCTPDPNMYLFNSQLPPEVLAPSGNQIQMTDNEGNIYLLFNYLDAITHCYPLTIERVKENKLK